MRFDPPVRAPCIPPRAECRGGLAELARRAGRGDAAALDQLLRSVQAPVRRYLARRLTAIPDADDQAMDLAQEVLVRAAAALPRCRFENDRRLMAWILTIARRVLIDHVRAECARADVVPAQPLDLLAERASMATWRGAPSAAEPGEAVAAAVARALETLPEATHELLRLRVQLECSWKEVAGALGTTEAGAKRRFQRAQATLRTRFRETVRALSPRERSRLPGWAAELAR